MKAIFVAVFITVLCVGLLSCKQQYGSLLDTSKLRIAIASPLLGKIYDRNDSVHIEVLLSCVDQLQECRFTLSDIKTGQVLLDESQPVLSDRFQISKTWMNNLSAPAALKLQVMVDMDLQGNRVRKDVFFYTN